MSSSSLLLASLFNKGRVDSRPQQHGTRLELLATVWVSLC